ncbi:MAG: helix-turn-helix domain-containing protein [Firmicutes bacterium]|nr:helix-turn-helix domain-containing protein [Bacillota bacterium]
MIKVQILKLLKERGRSKYWLYTQLGMSSSNFQKLADGKTTKISFEVLDALCDILECTPGDILTKE